MTKDFFIRSINMSTELSVAGQFILNSMACFEKIQDFSDSPNEFQALYFASVGLERMQKVLLVLLQEGGVSEIEKLCNSKSFKVHNLNNLNNKMGNKLQQKNMGPISLCQEEEDILTGLSNFYSSGRYGNFDTLVLSDNRASEILIKTLYKLGVDLCLNPISEHYINNVASREKWANVLGAISRKYYCKIVEVCEHENLFAYEVNPDSPAGKVFLPNPGEDENITHTMLIEEKRCVFELLIAIVNCKEESQFIKCLREIEPLDIDQALFPDFLRAIINGYVPRELCDEVSEIYVEEYEDKNALDDRCKLLDSFTCSSVIWDNELM